MEKLLYIILLAFSFGLALFIYKGNNDLFNILLGALFAGIPSIIVLLLQEIFNDNKFKKNRLGIIRSVILEIDSNIVIVKKIFPIQSDEIIGLKSMTFNGPLLTIIQLKNMEEHFDAFYFSEDAINRYDNYRQLIYGFEESAPFGNNTNHEILWSKAKLIIIVLAEFKQFLIHAINNSANFEKLDEKTIAEKTQTELAKLFVNIKES